LTFSLSGVSIRSKYHFEAHRWEGECLRDNKFSFSLKLEGFMSVDQHLPERRYPCGDCKQVFYSAEEFRDHLKRDGAWIVGCRTKVEGKIESMREA
jgi:hypothetical protein